MFQLYACPRRQPLPHCGVPASSLRCALPGSCVPSDNSTQPATYVGMVYSKENEEIVWYERPMISLIVRCRNEAKHIGKLLERVAQQTRKDVEVIVVDSGSTDGTLEIAAAHNTRILHIAPEAFSFGRSLNMGCDAARGDILVFASAHVFPIARDWLQTLVAPFSDSRIALAYGRQVGDASSKFSECRLFEKQFPATSNLDQQIPWCNNANAAVRRSLWQTHRFDESLTGLEDLAWGQWAIGEGYRIAYVAEAAVVHIHEETAARVMHRYEREAIALRRIVPDSHMYFHEFIRLAWRQIWGDLVAMVRERRTVRMLPEIVMFRTMQYWGTFRGMNLRSPVTQQLLHQFYYPED